MSLDKDIEVVGSCGTPDQALARIVTNTGNTTATFDVTVSGYTWPTTAPVTVGPLWAGASANVDVIVGIPTDAAGGAIDTAFITATSQGNSAKSATATLTTVAAALEPLPYDWFLPLIVKQPVGQWEEYSISQKSRRRENDRSVISYSGRGAVKPNTSVNPF